jgi:hypothetical protein
MSDDQPSNEQAVTQWERSAPQITFTWIDPGPIEAGEHIRPAKLNGELARKFAALHLIIDDLAFALDCMVEANKLGVPDATNLHSKALIFSAVVGYSRCFKSGVREVRLEPKGLEAAGVTFDHEIHEFLVALRDKHIAHSVNEFENCGAFAIVVGRPETGWRDGSAVGVNLQKNVGVSRELLQKAMSHIEALKGCLATKLEAQRLELYSEFKTAFAAGGHWEMVPIRVPDRENVSKRRQSK